ncbi:MAG: 30S ribosomal protein S13 [Methanomicrobiaceae archaeon]|uniref:Ssu ribosomal protein s18e (S13p) n=1 Tax=hydrocarbon metagenome TaxID=938273 RepID=A0A0W8FFL4_9ZZZZ|nr:30S ribosomal protein S13 [Methanomicrobiaceae archaeon]MDD5418817.1 30S ribosomal protein S13 [Methanomicrobiaceae archaeon]
MDEEEIKYFVRIRNTDLDGTKSVRIALTGITGVGPHTSHIISSLARVDPHAVLGKLDDESIGRLAQVVDEYTDRVPDWMVNRPKDVYAGDARHLFGTDLLLTREDDVNRMRKIRSYRGIRHETGQKVRGQRTKSTGRTGTTVGVKRKKS